MTYTFEATNNGDAPLNRPGATTGGPGTKDPGWVVDGHCDGAATYVSGDDDDNDLLDPGETWEFTCQNAVDGTDHQHRAHHRPALERRREPAAGDPESGTSRTPSSGSLQPGSR